LRQQLEKYKLVPRKIGTFSAASNVTGTIEDVTGVTRVLKEHGALSFWDYAGGGPYLDINMNPVLEGIPSELLTKDAVFLSPHKFPGGPGTPGVLVVKKSLLTNDIPSVPGGGTVFFVSPTHQRYLANVEEREEGGTQNILGMIRCGLVFQLKVSFFAYFLRLYVRSLLSCIEC
jgi:selenocysteine lyase/cysteine desulfurase